MDTSKLREAFLAAPEKQEDVPLPEWLAPFVDADTQLAIKDLPGDVLALLRKQHKNSQNQNDATFAASIICKCLINKADGQLVFQPTDRDALAQIGSTKLEGLFKQSGVFFGWTDTPVADAKKNSSQTETNSSGTPLLDGSLTQA